jgi:cyclic dehypoxanthinyl futalosine synthase
VRARQLLATGAWRGPRDASESYVEATDLPALGGISNAISAGVGLLVGAGDLDAHRLAHAAGARSLWRFSFERGESAVRRQARLEALRDMLRANEDHALALWGVMPTPEGEAEGLDTLQLVATLRLAVPEIWHVVLDVAALGPRLAQMALGFGGDELWAPIVSERALRLGGNANNPAMTRKEAAILIRGAGLAPTERIASETYREESE